MGTYELPIDVYDPVENRRRFMNSFTAEYFGGMSREAIIEAIDNAKGVVYKPGYGIEFKGNEITIADTYTNTINANIATLDSTQKQIIEGLRNGKLYSFQGP